MNKVNDGSLNEIAISMAAFKQSKLGDELVILTVDNNVGWFVVDALTATRGCKGGTTFVLRDLATNDLTTLALRNTLPEEIARVRRVSAGVNSRNLRKLTIAPVAAAAPKVPVIQPIGEFENILDVPDMDDEQEGEPLSSPVDLAEEMFPAIEVVAEVTPETISSTEDSTAAVG